MPSKDLPAGRMGACSRAIRLPPAEDSAHPEAATCAGQPLFGPPSRRNRSAGLPEQVLFLAYAATAADSRRRNPPSLFRRRHCSLVRISQEECHVLQFTGCCLRRTSRACQKIPSSEADCRATGRKSPEPHPACSPRRQHHNVCNGSKQSSGCADASESSGFKP